MRKAISLRDPRKARLLSAFLTSNGIENQLEVSTNENWESDHYRDVDCTIWIRNEDQLPKALKFLEEWSSIELTPMEAPPPPPIKRRILGPITLYLIATCCAFFAISILSEPELPQQIPAKLPATPLFTAPIKKNLLYDYPKTYELTDTFIQQYGEIKQLPQAGRELLREIDKGHYWKGLYPFSVNYLKGIKQEESGPFAEKIRQGQIWRLITPMLLHADIFHIFFNMLWLVVLGGQLERQLGWGRYIALIIIAACLSNTSQYIMSGPNFIGFSGVLSAMLSFIWYRLKVAPWEGYHLHPSNFTLFFGFIGAVAILQSLSFIAEVTLGTSFSLGIANTAHLSGALTGYLMAHIPYFTQQKSLPE